MDGDTPTFENAPYVWQPDEEPDAIGPPSPPPLTPEELEEAKDLAEQRNLLDDEYRRGAGLPPRGQVPQQ